MKCLIRAVLYQLSYLTATDMNSTALARLRKPARLKKPKKDWPLFPHKHGPWAKKFLKKLISSRSGRPRKLANQFLTTKKRLLENGELSPHTWKAYHDVCAELVETFGRDRLLTDLLPEDFEKLRARWAAKWGAERLATEINRARTVFNFAWKNGMVSAPMRSGEGFKRPSKKVLRLNKAEKGPMMFEADELRRMINKAAQPMKSMLLLVPEVKNAVAY